jgi:hypothetical protein
VGQTPGADAIAARERTLAERLLEDEALRGDLDDATWQPIQDWMLVQAHRIAAATTGMDDAAAQPVLDNGQAALRQVATTLADALAAGTTSPNFAQRIEPLHKQVRPPLVDAARARRVHAALRAVVSELVAQQVDSATAAARLAAVFRTGAGDVSADA